ncbi:Subtilisin-like protease [Thalictrum thalictroides]|uniref:Subtilisin-like protease n=1 Tax=Thalictrum thalictroides TaxID=46969 RepID=A0A7J6WLS7_THATH|nr:Subtilisin-like protease [Thalictrum thalictroides]
MVTSCMICSYEPEGSNLTTKVLSSNAEERAIYLVLMEGDPVAFREGATHFETGKRLDPHSKASKSHAKHLVRSHDQLLQSTLEVGSFNKLYSFKHIVNGFAVHTTPYQAEKLKSAKGVMVVEKDRGAKLMTTYTPQYLGLPLGVWTQAGRGRNSNAGEGIVIGVVDTGIDPTHPSFAYDPQNPFALSNNSQYSGGCTCETGPLFPGGSCNGKILSARYFAAGAQAIASLNASIDFLSPFDAVGHGSHVASTAAGNSGVPVVMNGFLYGHASGMAPRAGIAVYKAIYPSVATIADVVSAIDQATEDGVDILTLSIGPDEPPEDTITFLSVFDIFMLFAQRAGIFVVQAAGNHGPEPSSVVAYSPWAVAVAACNTDRSFPASLILGDGRIINGVGLSAPTFGNGTLQFKLVLAQDAVKTNGSFPRTPEYVEECQHPEALDPVVVQGSIVICKFSAGFYNQTSTVTAIIDTAKALEFMGFVLVANPAYGDFLAQPIPFSVPGVMIPKIADVQILSEYYEQQTQRRQGGAIYKGRASIGEGRLAYLQGRAPIVSRFSSRGPNILDTDGDLADVLKPDVLAPGHLVWAAWSPMSVLDSILTGNNFALLSGTSMAAPHVSGIAALIKQYNPSWTPSMIASSISTTASKYDNSGEIIMAEGPEIASIYPSTHFDIGAGLINPSLALDPGLVFPSDFNEYISFLCSLPHINTTVIKARTGQVCKNSLAYPTDLNLPSVTISALSGSRLVRRNIKNIAAKPETYLCSVLQPKGVDVNVYPPWFTVTSQGTRELYIKLNVTKPLNTFSFGEIVLTGSLDHIVRIPLSIDPVSY